jgi:predicted aldo/keto reductase-like oxidoreductase
MSVERVNLGRRKFIASSISSLASAGVAGFGAKPLLAQDTSKTAATDIIHRTLGKTGIKVPIVGMGVMNANNPEIVEAAYNVGIRHFDTAARYQYGRNEQMVGEVIKKLGARDKVVIGTKEMRPAQRGESNINETKNKLIELCEGSLRRLKTDHIDILYVHSVSNAEEVNDQGILEGMATLKKQGKILASGVSTHQAMTEVINAVAEIGDYDVVLTAFNVAMAANGDLLTAIENAAQKGIAIVAMKTQAGGSRLPNPGSLRNYSSTVIATASLKWVMRNENIAASIPGFDNYQHMHEDFSVVHDLSYTEEERKFLSDNEITIGLGFCHQCGQCVTDCPYDVDIPSLMRTHMYAAQYANFHEARCTLDDIAVGRGLTACNVCGDCTATCVNTVDIAARIANLKMMYG